MNTGQYHYDQMPLYYRRKFRAECKRQSVDFSVIMLSDCGGPFVLTSYIEWTASKDGMRFWSLVAQQRYTELDLNRPFNRWFRSSTLINYISEKATTIAVCSFILSVACVFIAIGASDRSNTEKNILIKELKRRDSINNQNIAIHMQDSIVASTLLPYKPANWDATLSKEEVYERMMDTAVIFEK